MYYTRKTTAAARCIRCSTKDISNPAPMTALMICTVLPTAAMHSTGKGVGRTPGGQHTVRVAAALCITWCIVSCKRLRLDGLCCALLQWPTMTEGCLHASHDVHRHVGGHHDDQRRCPKLSHSSALHRRSHPPPTTPHTPPPTHPPTPTTTTPTSVHNRCMLPHCSLPAAFAHPQYAARLDT
jgi:hypothetical protein